MAPRNPIYDVIREEFLAGKFRTLDDAARAHGIKPPRLRRVAAVGGWVEKRNEIAGKATQKADKKIADTMGNALAKFRMDALKSADVLTAKALETLTRPGLRLTPGEAINALKAAAQIQAQALGLNRNTGAEGQGGEGSLVSQNFNFIRAGSPEDGALLLTDADLAKIISAAVPARLKGKTPRIVDAPSPGKASS